MEGIRGSGSGVIGEEVVDRFKARLVTLGISLRQEGQPEFSSLTEEEL